MLESSVGGNGSISSTTMSSSSSGGGGGGGGGISADSYIGSLISLTSKSEIRYEGILYTIDTENSNIALQDVRSFGTEGRKKDGPQIPASDKVYDYIIFRGSDIKDLQVKSSPPAQAASQIHTDPAIISLQSQYPQPSTTSTLFGPVGSASLPDLGNSPFRGGAALHQATGNLGAWGSSHVPPGPSGTGLAVPMYWQGYYGHMSGFPHMQQQPLHFQQPPGMPIPPAVQQQLQQSTVRSSLPTELPSISAFSSLQASITPTLPSAESSSMAVPTPVITSSSGTSTTLSRPMPISSTETLNSALPSNLSLASSSQEISAIATPALSKPHAVTASTSSFQTISQTVSGPASSSLPTSAAPTLVTPGQLLQSGGPISSLKAQPSTQEHKVADSSSSVSQSVIPVANESKAQNVSTQPLLPLPTPTNQQKPSQQANGSVGHSSGSHRGRGRGRGRMVPHMSTKFTEDFDFTAMNEKFKKDEVWGHLGKEESRGKVEDGEENGAVEGNANNDEDLKQGPRSDPKPVYVKDDFFDSLSCDALDRSRNERIKFSEQRKIDTETFGSFPRSRTGRGNRGGGYRGNFRGSYYGGRGNGYSGRGRGGGRTFL
uniref:DFDF domain-containing protein n=1 Tax=Araucaria cunninghamii TaxID=56994 RepID=A0A0D6QWE0_ARACU